MPLGGAVYQQNKNKNHENKKRYDYSGHLFDIIYSKIKYRGIENNKQQKINIQVVVYMFFDGHYFLSRVFIY